MHLKMSSGKWPFCLSLHVLSAGQQSTAWKKFVKLAHIVVPLVWQASKIFLQIKHSHHDFKYFYLKSYL